MRATWTVLLAAILLAGCIPVPVPLPDPEPCCRDVPAPEAMMREIGEHASMDWHREVEQPEFHDDIDAALERDAEYFRLLRGDQRNLQVHPDLPPTDVPEKLHADTADDHDEGR